MLTTLFAVHPPLLLCTPLLGALLLGAAFDPGRGKIDLSGSAFSLGFEQSVTGLSLFDTQSQRTSGGLVSDDAEALEGAGMLEIGGNIADALIDIRPLAAALSGRRVEARFWQRAHGTKASASILWISGSADPLLMNDDPRTTFVIAELPFQPTGRATDDGWEEWSSGPIDFLAASMVAPAILRFYDRALYDLYSGAIPGPDPSARVRIDAFSLDDLGPAAVPGAACAMINEATTCGPEGACLYGRCTDGALVFGSIIADSDLRRDYTSRLAFEFSTFEGGRAPLTRIPDFQSALSALDGSATAASFWSTISTEIQGLGDGHASAPVVAVRSPLTSGVCVHMGEADLIAEPTQTHHPLVFSAPNTNPVGMMLKKGDALISVDGALVHDWAQGARRYFNYGGDPAAEEVVTTPMIMDAALQTGATLEFARCETSTASAPVPCTMSQVTHIRIDLAAIEAGIWSNNPPAWSGDGAICDFRFHRAVDTAQGRDYAFAGYVDQAGVRWVQFNGVPGQGDPGGQAWFNTMQSALSGGPQKILLDERLGDGGTIDAVDLIAGHLMAAADFYSAEVMPQLGRPLSDPLRSALRRCGESGNMMTDCGGFLELLIGSGQAVRGGDSASKLAVLLGEDVSGNDILTKIISFRRTGSTRIFGPAGTFGAYGFIWGLPAIAGDRAGGSIQAVDSIFRASASDPNATFTTSSGVPPDQVIYQKQSDAVRDVDTIVEAAKAWLNQ